MIGIIKIIIHEYEKLLTVDFFYKLKKILIFCKLKL
jgi:hypothetical protein